MTLSFPGPGAERPPHECEVAIELLERQLAIYQELEELSRRQPSLIEADDTDGLLSLLAERELVVDRLSVISDELAPLKADWPRVSASMSGSSRERCREAIDEIAVVAETLARRDAADRATLEQRRADVASELAGLRAGRGALSAYGPERASVPRFQDREA
jgi:hypothetical protein